MDYAIGTTGTPWRRRRFKTGDAPQTRQRPKPGFVPRLAVAALGDDLAAPALRILLFPQGLAPAFVRVHRRFELHPQGRALELEHLPEGVFEVSPVRRLHPVQAGAVDH